MTTRSMLHLPTRRTGTTTDTIDLTYLYLDGGYHNTDTALREPNGSRPAKYVCAALDRRTEVNPYPDWDRKSKICIG